MVGQLERDRRTLLGHRRPAGPTARPRSSCGVPSASLQPRRCPSSRGCVTRSVSSRTDNSQDVNGQYCQVNPPPRQCAGAARGAAQAARRRDDDRAGWTACAPRSTTQSTRSPRDESRSAALNHRVDYSQRVADDRRPPAARRRRDSPRAADSRSAGRRDAGHVLRSRPASR